MGHFGYGTKRYFIEELFADGKTKREAYVALSEAVNSQRKPWVFTANVDGRRVPKPLSEQLTELEHEISRVYNLLRRMNDLGGKVERKSPPQTPEVEIKEDPKPPKAKGKMTRNEHKIRFISEWKRLRRFIADTAAKNGSNPVDSLDSMRPIRDANGLIDQGISCDTLVYSMVMHWPKVTREMAGVKEVNFGDESESLGAGFHYLASYVLKLAQARQNIMLIGPAGSGKSYLAAQVATMIKTDSHPDGLPYGETPMTPGATRGDLLGRHTINGFIPSKFVEIYSGGGVFNFEEMDAADPSMLIVVNNALASDKLFNSANGEVYEKHPDFIAACTMNTFGMGADAKYTGRDKIDLATIDRFRMGRVLVDLDETLAESFMILD